MTKKYMKLLDDVNVNRWHTNISKGSVVNADVSLKGLGRFCASTKMTPKKYAALPVEKMEDVAQDYINNLEAAANPRTGKPYSPGYVDINLTIIRSWAEWNRKPFQRKIKIANASATPTLENERCPEPDELRRVLYGDRTDLRTRVSIAIMAFSGCRPEVQGNYLGLDGLRLGDFPELKISGNEVVLEKTPTFIVVREVISKSRRRYMTLLGDEGCDILKQYLDRRISEGEKLGPHSGLIVTSSESAARSSRFGMEDKSPFLRTPKISEKIKDAMLAVGLQWRPYVWRSYFDTKLMVAESKGLVTHAYQQFWMGHVGDIERTYTLNKHLLPDEVTESMRSSYGKTFQLLETSTRRSEQVDFQRILREQLLLAAGLTQQQLAKIDVEQIEQDKFQEILRQRLYGNAVNHNGAGAQRIVGISELDSLIPAGYEFLSPHPADTSKCIVKLPSF